MLYGSRRFVIESSAMDAEQKKTHYKKLTETELLKNKTLLGPGSEDGQIITQILAERLALPEEQFKKTYNLARFAASVSFIAALAAVAAALAAWASAWSQYAHTRDALSQSRQPSASIAPMLSPSP